MIKRRLKAFSVETNYIYSMNIFYTKAKNGKEAIRNLINKSCDFKNMLENRESNNMTIKVEHLKSRGLE